MRRPFLQLQMMAALQQGDQFPRSPTVLLPQLHHLFFNLRRRLPRGVMRPPAHFTQLHDARRLFVSPQPPVPGIPRDPELPAQSTHPPPADTRSGAKSDSLFLQVHLLPRHRNPLCKDPPCAVQSVRDVLLESVRYVLPPYSTPEPFPKLQALVALGHALF